MGIACGPLLKSITIHSRVFVVSPHMGAQYTQSLFPPSLMHLLCPEVLVGAHSIVAHFSWF